MVVDIYTNEKKKGKHHNSFGKFSTTNCGHDRYLRSTTNYKTNNLDARKRKHKHFTFVYWKGLGRSSEGLPHVPLVLTLSTPSSRLNHRRLTVIDRRCKRRVFYTTFILVRLQVNSLRLSIWMVPSHTTCLPYTSSLLVSPLEVP